MLIVTILVTWCLVAVVLGFGIGAALSIAEKRRPRLRRTNFDPAA